MRSCASQSTMGCAPGRQVACLLWALVFGALHVQYTTAQTVIRAPLTDKAAIQAAINAQTGNSATEVVLEIAGGLFDLGSNFIKLNKRGVSLRGSTDPANPTIFGSSVETLASGGLGSPAATSCLGNPPVDSGVPMLQVCGMTGSSTQRIVIENIIFRNTRPNPFDNPTVPNQKGMLIAVSGTAGNPSIVRNCRFENIWQRSGGAGIGIEMQTGNTALHWLIQGNVFDGTRQGVFINDNDDVQIIGNTFTKFWTGVRQSASDVSTNLVIRDNSFVSGWPADSTIPLGETQGIALAAASTSTTQDKQWVIQNNKISGVEYGILIRYPTSPPFPTALSMNGVVISTNSIIADFRCSFSCANVKNEAAVQLPPMGGNWWGTPNPSADSFYPPLGTSPSAPVIEPWIVVPGPSTCTNGSPGFCPSDPIYSNDVVPVIVSVVINPSTVSPGQSFTVTVTLAQAVAGTLRFTSAPLGVSCPTVTLSVSDNPITVTCTAPQSAIVQIAGVSGSAEGELQAVAEQAVRVPDTAMAAEQPPTADASVQVADDVEAQAAYMPGLHGDGAWPRFVRHQLTNQAATRVYTITAIVTADRSTTKADNLMVCDNEPWPFTAEVEGCHQCSYSCGTRTFSCASCSCSCPRYDHPYVPTEKPYEEDHEERREYADKLYADKERRYEGEADADEPSFRASDGGGKPEYYYSSDKNVKDEEYEDKAPYSKKSYDNKETAKEGRTKYGGESEEAHEPSHDEHHAYEDRPRYEEASHGHSGDHGQHYENEYDGPSADKSYGHHPSHEDSYKDSNYAGKGEYGGDEESYSKHRYKHSSSDQGYGEEVHLQGDTTPDADCDSDTAKKCVCGPRPFIVPAGCKKIAYSPCDNTLRCSEEAHY